MIQNFKKLDVQEIELMFKAPLLVSILVAGADGNISKKEVSVAAHFVEKQTKIKAELGEFFRDVAQDFEDKMMVLLQEYPHDTNQRNLLIVEDLSKLNAILPKITPEFTIEFYAVLKRIAHEVASSSGGILGMNTIDDEEAKYLELHMIENPAEKFQ
jgi:hypothetical protein